MERKKRTTINILLWIAQVFLAAVLAWSGFMKIFQPEKLPFPWIKENANLAFFTGIVDLLGGIGVVLPALLRIKPVLTILAAYGIIALMIAATIFHISRGEAKNIWFNIFLAALAAFVAWGRRKNTPMLPAGRTKTGDFGRTS